GPATPDPGRPQLVRRAPGEGSPLMRRKTPMRTTIAILALVTAASPARAQSEDHLRAFFEGKTVRLKLDVPGSSEGVDVSPGTAQPVDFPRHASRLKRFGTAYRRGEEVLV